MNLFASSLAATYDTFLQTLFLIHLLALLWSIARIRVAGERVRLDPLVMVQTRDMRTAITYAVLISQILLFSAACIAFALTYLIPYPSDTPFSSRLAASDMLLQSVYTADFSSVGMWVSLLLYNVGMIIFLLAMFVFSSQWVYIINFTLGEEFLVPHRAGFVQYLVGLVFCFLSIVLTAWLSVHQSWAIARSVTRLIFAIQCLILTCYGMWAIRHLRRTLRIRRIQINSLTSVSAIIRMQQLEFMVEYAVYFVVFLGMYGICYLMVDIDTLSRAYNIGSSQFAGAGLTFLGWFSSAAMFPVLILVLFPRPYVTLLIMLTLLTDDSVGMDPAVHLLNNPEVSVSHLSTVLETIITNRARNHRESIGFSTFMRNSTIMPLDEMTRKQMLNESLSRIIDGVIPIETIRSMPSAPSRSNSSFFLGQRLRLSIRSGVSRISNASDWGLRSVGQLSPLYPTSTSTRVSTSTNPGASYPQIPPVPPLPLIQRAPGSLNKGEPASPYVVTLSRSFGSQLHRQADPLGGTVGFSNPLQTSTLPPIANSSPILMNPDEIEKVISDSATEAMRDLSKPTTRLRSLSNFMSPLALSLTELNAEMKRTNTQKSNGIKPNGAAPTPKKSLRGKTPPVSAPRSPSSANTSQMGPWPSRSASSSSNLSVYSRAGPSAQISANVPALPPNPAVVMPAPEPLSHGGRRKKNPNMAVFTHGRAGDTPGPRTAEGLLLTPTTRSSPLATSPPINASMLNQSNSVSIVVQSPQPPPKPSMASMITATTPSSLVVSVASRPSLDRLPTSTGTSQRSSILPSPAYGSTVAFDRMELPPLPSPVMVTSIVLPSPVDPVGPATPCAEQMDPPRSPAHPSLPRLCLSSVGCPENGETSPLVSPSPDDIDEALHPLLSPLGTFYPFPLDQLKPPCPTYSRGRTPIFSQTLLPEIQDHFTSPNLLSEDRVVRAECDRETESDLGLSPHDVVSAALPPQVIDSIIRPEVTRRRGTYSGRSPVWSRETLVTSPSKPRASREEGEDSDFDLQEETAAALSAFPHPPGTRVNARALENLGLRIPAPLVTTPTFPFNDSSSTIHGSRDMGLRLSSLECLRISSVANLPYYSRPRPKSQSLSEVVVTTGLNGDPVGGADLGAGVHMGGILPVRSSVQSQLHWTNPINQSRGSYSLRPISMSRSTTAVSDVSMGTSSHGSTNNDGSDNGHSRYLYPRSLPPLDSTWLNQLGIAQAISGEAFDPEPPRPVLRTSVYVRESRKPSFALDSLSNIHSFSSSDYSSPFGELNGGGGGEREAEGVTGGLRSSVSSLDRQPSRKRRLKFKGNLEHKVLRTVELAENFDYRLKFSTDPARKRQIQVLPPAELNPANPIRARAFSTAYVSPPLPIPMSTTSSGGSQIGSPRSHERPQSLVSPPPRSMGFSISRRQGSRLNVALSLEELFNTKAARQHHRDGQSHPLHSPNELSDDPGADLNVSGRIHRDLFASDSLVTTSSQSLSTSFTHSDSQISPIPSIRSSLSSCSLLGRHTSFGKIIRTINPGPGASADDADVEADIAAPHHPCTLNYLQDVGYSFAESHKSIQSVLNVSRHSSSAASRERSSSSLFFHPLLPFIPQRLSQPDPAFPPRFHGRSPSANALLAMTMAMPPPGSHTNVEGGGPADLKYGRPKTMFNPSTRRSRLAQSTRMSQPYSPDSHSTQPQYSRKSQH
ncbi:hypothetical protein H4R33_001880 [Dimargaris cristalligena]|nr:hypothetical protein H4R33_001880 [Dimargaris cristalligena]